MKNRIEAILVCILLIASSLVIVLPVEAMKLSGNTLYVGGSGPGNYTRIQDAIDDASDGDIIFVYSGIYFGTININKSIILQGQDKYSSILDGESAKNLIILRKDDIQIIGFTIRNADRGIFTEKSSYDVISDNIIEDVYYGIAIDVQNPYDDIIKSTISNCVIRNTHYGIFVFQSYSHNINNNRISNNYIGIYLDDSSSNKINNNIFEKNKYGIMLEHWYMYYPSYSNNITYNNFTKNTYGIYFNGNHDSNIVSKNNFIKNTISFTFLYNLYNPAINSIFQNYWDRPRSSPKLILGFIYFFLPLPWVIIDWNPAREPYDI